MKAGSSKATRTCRGADSALSGTLHSVCNSLRRLRSSVDHCVPDASCTKTWLHELIALSLEPMVCKLFGDTSTCTQVRASYKSLVFATSMVARDIMGSAGSAAIHIAGRAEPHLGCHGNPVQHLEERGAHDSRRRRAAGNGRGVVVAQDKAHAALAEAVPTQQHHAMLAGQPV
jgi:hypothetical protein